MSVRVWEGNFCIGRLLASVFLSAVASYLTTGVPRARLCMTRIFVWYNLRPVCLKEVLGYRHVTRQREICIKCKEHKALAAEAAYPNPPKKKPPPDLFIVGLRETRLPRGEPRTSKCTIDAPRDSSELNSPCFYGLCIPYWTWEASPLLHPRDLRLLTQKTTDCPGPSAPPP